MALLFVGVVLGGGNREHIVPVGALVAAIIGGGIALGQLQVARVRHEEQTKADLQRRITESFTKAVEQLGNEKITTRLGGIYTLQRISKESADDYWPVMEMLTGFVRVHARWKEGEGEATLPLNYEPPADVAAVLTMIVLRRDKDREREVREQLYFDLSGADLRGAIMPEVHLEGAVLFRVHLEQAALREAHLEQAALVRAHLEGANLSGAHLEGADLSGAHFKGASLDGAHFGGADLDGADLQHAKGLTQAQLDSAHGDTATSLPKGLTRPAHWPPAQEKG